MSRFKVDMRPPPRSAFEGFRAVSSRRVEHAALVATHRGAQKALREVRAAMSAGGLARLGNAFGAGSDLARTGKVYRRGGGSFNASGDVHIRSKSKRTLGAIASYTEGAEITPKRGRWLWIATDEIPRLAKGRFRMTPELYRSGGYEQSIGPLVKIRGIDGRPLLIVKDASSSAAGLKRRAKSRTKRGGLRAGQRARPLIVAFVAIPRTSRAARVNVTDILNAERAALPAAALAELERTA